MFTKIMLKIAGVLASGGAICLVIAFSMGLTEESFEQMVKDNKFSIQVDGGEIKFFGHDVTDYSNDKKHHENTEGELKIEENCTKLDLEFGAGLLEIYYDDVAEICIEENNVIGYEVTTDEDGTLRVRGGLDADDVVVGEDGSTLKIIIPQDMFFEEIDIEIGASQATIEGLKADKISVAVGAGQANMQNIDCRKLEMEVGAGEANVKMLQVGNLDVEAGLGEVDIEISGKESDYNYCIKCGIGNVQVGNSSYGGLGAEQDITNPGAEYVIDIECGIGEVSVQFNE